MEKMQDPILFIIAGACSFGSMVTLELLGIPYQVCLTDEKIRASAEFKKVNPLGKVAALKDSQVCVGENIAIIQYLLDAYGDNDTGSKEVEAVGIYKGNTDWDYKFFPTRQDLSNRAKMYQWLSYCSSTLHPAFSQVNYAQRYAPQNTEEFKTEAYKRLLLVLDYVDNALQDGYLLFKDYFSIVDAQAYGLLRWISYIPQHEELLLARPNIEEFFTKVKGITAVQNALDIEQQKLEDLKNSKFKGYFKINV